MVFPTIQYDATNGSDTAPTGADGSGTNGDLSTTTLTLNETVDFTGVADDDSDYLWYEGNAGDRHLFQITAFNPSVAACTSLTLANSGTTRTGSNWAVNGERKTLENDSSQKDWEDLLPGWKLEFQDGTYDLTAMIDGIAGNYIDGHIHFVAASGAAPILRTTANVRHFDGLPNITLQGIEFTTSASPKTSTMLTRASSATDGTGFIEGCTVDGLQYGISGYFQNEICVKNTTIKNCVSHAIYGESYGVVGSFTNCKISDNGGWGMEEGSSATGGHCAFLHCEIHNNTLGGLTVNKRQPTIIHNCTIVGNGGPAIKVPTAYTAARGPHQFHNNLITNNIGAGIDNSHITDYVKADYNAFYSNSGGDYSGNISEGGNDVVLSADPYTAIGSDDFTLNNTAGGGADCRNAGENNLDIGAYQHADAGGGGGGLITTGMSGGINR